MQNLETTNELYKVYKYKFKQPQLETVSKSVLIVEDDRTLKPLWERIFDLIDEDIQVDWITTAEEAEKLIRHRFISGRPYNLVIADISLDGNKTGIDLWNRYGEEANQFAIVSGYPISNYDFQSHLDFGLPPYFRKPLNVKLCFEIADMLNGKSE